MTISLQNLHQSCKETHGEFTKNQMTLKCQGQGQTHQKPWKTTFWAITLEPEAVETYGWLQNVYWQNTNRTVGLPSDKWAAVFASHDVKTIHFCKCFLQSIKVIIDQSQGQISRSKVKEKGQGKRSRWNVKGQGHVFSVLQQYWSQIILYSLHTFHLSH